MASYWDSYLDEVGNKLKDISPRDLLKGFYDYLEDRGFQFVYERETNGG